MSRAFVRGANAGIRADGGFAFDSLGRGVMIVVAVFVIDCLTPRGIAPDRYTLPPLSAVAIRHPKAIAATATICSVLAFAGWFISPRQGHLEWWVFVNRALVLGVIWAAAGMADVWRRFQEASSSKCRRPSCSTRRQPFPLQLSFRDALKNSLEDLLRHRRLACRVTFMCATAADNTLWRRMYGTWLRREVSSCSRSQREAFGFRKARVLLGGPGGPENRSRLQTSVHRLTINGSRSRIGSGL